MIQQLAEHEEAISELYDAYCRRFEKYKTFWATLSFEEADHAKKLRVLIEEKKAGNVAYDSTKYDLKIIKTSIDYIAQQIKRLETEEVTLTNALSVALNIEKAIIDGKVFEAFKGYTQKTRQIIRDLTKSVTDHYQVIEQEWSSHRKYS